MSAPDKDRHPHSAPDDEIPQEHYDDPVLLEEDETVPPRPEEEIADRLRPEPQG